MADIVKVEYLNDVYMKVLADPGIRQELYEYFAFQPSNYKFSPKYKNKVWDGYIRLYSPFKPFLYVGLLDLLKKFCIDREYEIEIPEELERKESVSNDYGFELAKMLGMKLEPRQYQNDYVVESLKHNRLLIQSPTASGKSFTMFMMQQHYNHVYGHRTLIIVPVISLVDQMIGDFVSYGLPRDEIYGIQAGVDKDTKASVVVSTWQSLMKVDSEWLSQFKVVLGDECHLFTAKSLIDIMEKMQHTPYRFGFTGTVVKDSKCHVLVLQGLFGSLRKFVSTKELIDSGTLADLKIKAIVLKHSKESRVEYANIIKSIKDPDDKKNFYVHERNFLTNDNKRNLFIRNLVWSLKNQNNLILFDLVEKHGKILEPMLRKEGRILHFVHGEISKEEREKIRVAIAEDKEHRHDVLASFGTFSTGINIPKISNAILASGSKSEVRILQSIGRALRKGEGAEEATIYDIADDLKIGKIKNYTLEHLKKRIEIYSQERFEFKIYNIDL
jgi:superfamily II DNA or RNA helicase